MVDLITAGTAVVQGAVLVKEVGECYKAIKKLTPDGRTEEAIKEVFQDIELEILTRVRAIETATEDIPTIEDIKQAAREVIEAADTAGDNKKRWLLFNAFFNRINPKYYKEGLHNVLWKIAKTFEYPEAVALRNLTKGFFAKSEANKQIHMDHEAFPYIGKFERNGFLISKLGTSYKGITMSMFAWAFREFIWERAPAYKPEGVDENE